MKAPQVFCCVLALITSCVFILKAESTAGQMLGYIVAIGVLALPGIHVIVKRVQDSR